MSQDQNKETQRTPCQIYSRVVGFYNEVSNFNNGKKSEFYSRRFYDSNKSMNARFSEKYACGPKCEEKTSAYDLITSKTMQVPVSCNI